MAGARTKTGTKKKRANPATGYGRYQKRTASGKNSKSRTVKKTNIFGW